jgi:spore germination protein GerM
MKNSMLTWFLGFALLIAIILLILNTAQRKNSQKVLLENLSSELSEEENAKTNEEAVPFLDENDQAITSTVSIFYNNQTNDPNLIHCGDVFPVIRQVTHTGGVAQATLEALIAGPTKAEVNALYSTAIPSTASINSLSIYNGVASVDVSADFFKVGGSCGTASAYMSLEKTLLQFPTVTSIELTVDGFVWSDFAQNLV